jgi:tetratricopeptide (TPR) repeat protein
MLKKIIIVLLTTVSLSVTYAQRSTVYTDPQLSFKKGMELYEQGLYGQAQAEFAQTLDMINHGSEHEFGAIKALSELHNAKCAVQMGKPEGETLILDYIRKYSPDPAAGQALVDMGNYYYNAKQYDKANQFYEMIDNGGLSGAQRMEVKFKQAYSYFVNKKFAQAKAGFRLVKETDGQYYYPANYYYGMCEFFDSNYDAAIKAFQKAAEFKKYKQVVPYYICQIHFAKGEYDKLLSYGEPIWDDADVANKKEIRQLLGQAYFEKGDYKKALPHFVAYAEEASGMREEEFYQLAFTQYKLGDYKNALRNFEEISRTDSKLGQIGAYYFGDCSLKTGNKAAARTAFGSASRLDYDKALQEEALINYGKLSYELKYDQDAVNALQKIKSSSKYYTDAQNVLGNLFLNTRDYERALSIMDGMPTKSPQMKEAYQKVLYYRGVQYFNDGNAAKARELFTRSLDVPIDNKVKALSLYGLADLEAQEKDYSQSITYLNQYFTIAKTVSNMPDDASVHTANYMQGYNYLKQEKYSNALTYFQEAVNGIKKNANSITNQNVEKNILGDATLRAGDCYFKNRNYAQAVKNYDEAIKNKYTGYVYALYQKAIIESLQDNKDEAIIAFERLARDYPTSDYADDALLRVGRTYIQNNQLNKAVAPLKKLTSDYKGKSNLVVQGLLSLGLVYTNQNAPETAVNYYKEVFKNNPSQEEGKQAIEALEELYVTNLGKPDEYTDFLATVPGYKVTEGDKEAVNFKSAESKYESGNFDGAITAYTDYLKRFPNSANALTAQFKRAESYVSKAKSQTKGSAEAKKNWKNAMADYEAVANKGQSNYFVKSLKKAATIAYNSEEDFAKSYDLYSKLEKAAPNDAERTEAQKGALEAAYRLNNAAGVKEMATKISKNPNASPDYIAIAQYYVGKTAFDSKDYETALKAFSEVIKLKPNDDEAAEARYDIAYIYYVRRNLDEAENRCQAANQESSNTFWMAKGTILLSDVYAERGDNSTAQAILEGLLDNYSENKDVVKEAKDKLDALKGKAKTKSKLIDGKKDNGKLELDGDN